MHAFFDLAPYSEDFLRRVIASSPDCIKVLDLEGRLVAMSEGGQKVLEITDLTPHLQTCWTGWWTGEAQEDARKAVETAKGGGTGRFEAFARNFGGTPKWWDVTVSPILGADGRPEKLLSVSRDITEGKEAALKLAESTAKLAESEQRLRLILESVQDYAIFTMDTAGLVTTWNVGAEHVFGYRNEEIIGRNAEVLWMPADRAQGVPATEMATAKDKGNADDIRWHQRKDGTRFYAVGAMRPLRDEAGGLRGFTKVCRDVTAKHQAEQDLASSRAQIAATTEAERVRLTEVFQRSPAFLAVLHGPEHIFEMVNDRYYQLVGYRDILHQSVRAALPELVGQGFFELLDGVYTTGEPFVGNDVPILLQREANQQPEQRFVDFVYQPTYAPDNTVSGILVHGVDVTERKQSAVALARIAEQRRLALDSAQMGSWHYDLASGLVHWDERFKMIFGVADEELNYERVLEILQPADREKVRAAIDAASRPVDPVPYSIEYRVLHPDGSEHWIEAHGRTYFEEKDGARRAVYLVGTVRDITEEKLARETLRQSEEKYRSIFDSIDQAFAVLEIIRDEHDRPVDYRFVEVNPAMVRHTGWQNARGKTAGELIPNLEAHWPETYGKVERTGEPIRFVQGAVGMGRIFDAYAFRTGSSEHPQVAIIFQDVTEQRNASATLAQVSEQRRLALDSAQMGWWHYDPATGTVDWDPRARVLYGLNAEHVTYDQAMATIHRDDLPQRDAAFQAAVRLDGPQPQYETEYRVQQPDGSWRWLQIRGKATFVGEGTERRAISMDGTVADVTSSKAAQEALLESERKFRQMADSERAARTQAEQTSQLKDEFLATLSHELRTPLNAILGWTQVLRGDPANTEDMEAGLATIERNSRAQTQIIEDLLDMSKIISGKVRLDVQPLQLDQVVAAAVETMQPAAAAKGIRLQALVDPQARMISGDPNRLQQVFWNLLSNALKFTPKSGKVQVILERVNSHLEVSVADTGEGIVPEFLPYVFDRFRQQDATTTRKHGGLGLGLAIVKQLVELHGGSIQVESAGFGKGTTFRVLLPLSVVQPVPDPADPTRRHPQSGGNLLPIPAEGLNLAGVKVLVVDDEADARALVQRLLEDRGAIVQSAGSVAAAMQQIQSQRPDVLVSDIGMPEEDGYALIRQVRALSAEQGGSLPAVALTAYARSEDRLKVILAGFQMHMAKPVEAAELLALVASLAGRVIGH